MHEGKGGRGAGGQSYGGSAPPLQHACPHIDPGHKLRRGSLRMQVEPQWAGGSAMCLACWSLRPHVASSGSRRQSLLGGRPQQPWNSPLNLGPSRSGKSNRAKLHRWATRCLKVALCATNRSACVGHSPSPSWKPSSLRAGRLAPGSSTILFSLFLSNPRNSCLGPVCRNERPNRIWRLLILSRTSAVQLRLNAMETGPGARLGPRTRTSPNPRHRRANRSRAEASSSASPRAVR